MKRFLLLFLCICLLTAAVSCAGDPVVPSEVSDPGSRESSAAQYSEEGSEGSSSLPAPVSSEPPQESADGSSPAGDDSVPGQDASEPEPSADPSSDNSGDPVSGSESADQSDPSSEEPGDDVSDEPSAPVRINILEGRHYTVSGGGYRSDGFGDFEADERTCRYRLTDGAAADAGDAETICGYNSGTVSFYFDLGADYEIDGWETDLWGGDWSIPDPSEAKVSFYWSSNAKWYFPVGESAPDSGSLESIGNFRKGTAGAEFDYPVRARYLRIDYQTDSFVWTSELRAYGQETESDIRIPRINITTEGGDRVHKSAYHPCTLEIIDPYKQFDTILDEHGEIKVRGNSTSSGAKQPYNIKFSAKTNVLGMGAAKKWYLLANMYDKTQLRNKLSYDFADDIGMAYVQQSTFVRVYLNGKYQGIYQLCESIGVGESRININTNKNEFLFEFEPWEQYSNPNWIRTTNYAILLGFNEPENPTDAQRAWLKDFFRKAESAISSKNIAEIEKYIDVDSFIDDYIVQEYFKQVDYATSSTRFYIKGDKWYAGPVWDFDLSSGNCSSTYYTGYNNVGGSGNSWEGFACLGLWNNALFKTPEIKQRLVDRYKELQPYIVNLYQDNEIGKCKIDQLVETFGKEISYNYSIWSTSEVYSELERVPTDGTYVSEILYLKDWLKKRNEWLLDYYGIQ